MKTIADIIGVPNDPLVEEIRSIFSQESGKIDQASRQRQALSPVELRRMEWRAAERLVNTVKSYDGFKK